MFKLSISNIGWRECDSPQVFALMKSYGFCGLEIAPTKVYPVSTYEELGTVKKWKEELQAKYGFFLSSMQSIWHGRHEQLFGSSREMRALEGYTQKAIDFAEAAGCKNMVFGCSGNRSIPKGGDANTAVPFFKRLGDYAYERHVAIAIEANPPIFHTNFLNTTEEVLAFIEKTGSKGIRLNLDTGAMIENGEHLSILNGREQLVSHVHISEPGLEPIQERSLHKELSWMLRDIGYQEYVSIETRQQDDIGELKKMMEYVSSIFK